MSEAKYTPPEVVIGKNDIVFIDTCIFDSFKYSFDAPQFKSLANLKAEIGFSVVISAVVEGEVLSHIERSYAKALADVQKMGDDIGSDYSKDFKPLIEQASATVLKTKAEVLISWSKFKERLNVVVLPYELVTTAEIFARYMEVKPPFDAKTKSEFPDAFSAIALEKHKADVGAHESVIISTDGIFSKYEALYPDWKVFKRLQEFLTSAAQNKRNPQPIIVMPPSIPPILVPNIEWIPPPPPIKLEAASDNIVSVTTQFSDASEFELHTEGDDDNKEQVAQSYRVLTELISSNAHEVERRVHEYLEGLPIEVHGTFYVDDEFIDIEYVQLQSFRIDEIDMESQTARVEVTMDISASLSYVCNIWDSIDKEYVAVGSGNSSISGEYTGFLEVYFEEDCFHVEDVEFEALNDLSIYAEIDD